MHNWSWVSFCVGQWVMACDPLFTLMTMITTITYVAYPVSGVKDAARARKDGHGSATSLQRVRSADTPVAADSPSHQLSLRNTVTTQRHATSPPVASPLSQTSRQSLLQCTVQRASSVELRVRDRWLATRQIAAHAAALTAAAPPL